MSQVKYDWLFVYTSPYIKVDSTDTNYFCLFCGKRLLFICQKCEKSLPSPVKAWKEREQERERVRGGKGVTKWLKTKVIARDRLQLYAEEEWRIHLTLWRTRGEKKERESGQVDLTLGVWLSMSLLSLVARAKVTLWMHVNIGYFERQSVSRGHLKLQARRVHLRERERERESVCVCDSQVTRYNMAWKTIVASMTGYLAMQ